MKSPFKIPLSFFFVLSSFFSFSQTNLVPNFSFEQYDTCPDYTSQIDRAIPWFQPTTGTPDYFNICFYDSANPTSNIVDVPTNLLGHQNAKSGIAYAGVFASYAPWWVTYREYLQVELSDTLIANITYYVNFYVSLSDSSIYATDAIGLYFSNDSILSSNYNELNVIPQIVNLTGNYITDKTNWVLISGTYTAIGGETFLTIGNFKNNSNTTSIYVGGGDTVTYPDYNGAYYYIDNICVSSDSSACLATGIAEYNINNTTVFFNYFNHSLFIESIDPIKKIEVYDLLGNLLLIEKCGGNSNQEEIYIDLNCKHPQ